jgi:hypothetical protein
MHRSYQESPGGAGTCQSQRCALELGDRVERAWSGSEEGAH